VSRRSGKPLSPQEVGRQRAGVLAKVKTDTTILNFHDLASAMSTSLARIHEALGPEKMRVSKELARRRRSWARVAWELEGRPGPRPKRERYEWKSYTKKGQRRRSEEEQRFRDEFITKRDQAALSSPTTVDFDFDEFLASF
jgi:hypothetical protein